MGSLEVCEMVRGLSMKTNHKCENFNFFFCYVNGNCSNVRKGALKLMKEKIF